MMIAQMVVQKYMNYTAMQEVNFKHTEIGLIPHDWEVKTLGEILTICNGRDYKHLPYGNVTVYGTGGVIAMVNDYLYDGETICIGRKGTIDKPQYHKGKIWTVDTLFYTKDFEAYPLFLYYKSKTINWLSINEATGVPSLTSKNIAKVNVALPPTLAEQERIAGALSSIDTLIGALNEQIEKKRHIKQGTMQQLLTGKKRLAGFTGEWKEVRLGDVAKMNSGGTPTSTNPAYYNGDIPFLSISDMTSSGKYIQSTEKTITQLGLENSSARLFPACTLMYAMYASIGKCSITNIDTAISQAILGFKLSDALDRDYLYYHFCFIENIVKDMGQTGTQSNLSKKIVEDFELTIPPTIAEQSAIAAVLSGMDTEIAALEQKCDKYIAIKSGMMQDLLTGKIRLV